MPLTNARRAHRTGEDLSDADLLSPGRILDTSVTDRSRSRRRGRLTTEPRRGVLAAAGAATVILCAALGAVVAGRANERHDYLAIARYVPQGAMISTAELGSVSITPAAGLGAIPVTNQASVLGRHAAVALEPGALVVRADLTTAPSLPAAAALVGTSLNADQVPLALAAGDHVLVLLGGPSSALQAATAAPGAGSSGSPARSTGLLARGIVAAVGSAAGQASASGTEVVTVEVPVASAPAVAAASAAGDVSLAEVPAAPKP